MPERDSDAARDPADEQGPDEESHAADETVEGADAKGGKEDKAKEKKAGANGDNFTSFVREGLSLLLPLVISGAGLAALVIGVGGAVSVARFHAAGLPWSQAVDAASESDMRAIGLTWLITFGLVGLLAVLLAYIASPNGKATAAMHYALIGIAGVEIGVVWVLARGDSGNDMGAWDIAAGVVLVLVIGVAVWVVARRHLQTVAGRRPPPFGTVVARLVLQPKWTRELSGKRRPGPLVPRAAKCSFGEQPMGGDTKEGDRVVDLTFWDYVWLGLLSIGAATAAGLMLGHWWVTFSILSAGALGLLTIRVAALNAKDPALNAKDPKFRWYGVCVFFSVGLFGAALGVFRMADEPRLQPVAFLHTQGDQVTAMQGIYVGESDDRFWFASVALEECGDSDVRPGSGRLRWVPADEVSHVSIGPQMGLPKLAHEAMAMFDAVRAEHEGDETVATLQAVRDSVAIRSLGRARKASGWWLEVGAREDLGAAPQVMLRGRRLRLRHPLEAVAPEPSPALAAWFARPGSGRFTIANAVEEAGLDKETNAAGNDARRMKENTDRWQVRLPRRARSGAVYANCGERTNTAWLTVHARPHALPTATDQGDGTWVLDGRGSSDPDGHLSYSWRVGGKEMEGRAVVDVPADQAGSIATLTVRDDSRIPDGAEVPKGLADDRTVRLRGTVARTFPSDLLFRFDRRELTDAGKRRVRALRHDAVGAHKVVVWAHTDERGSKRHNRRLSRYRARAVARALFHGMLRPPKDRKVRGRGEGDPSDPGDHRQNRRVEVFIYR
jgi:outer membrane protein OmpA-like peptidoglycan-associated protein